VARPSINEAHDLLLALERDRRHTGIERRYVRGPGGHIVLLEGKQFGVVQAEALSKIFDSFVHPFRECL